MRRFQKFLYPIMFFCRAAKRAAAALAVGVVAVAVLAVGVSGEVAGAATPSPGWPQLHDGPDRTGYQPSETRIGTGNVSRLAQARTYHAAANLSAPLIANGVLYVDTGTLYAFDATGAANCSAAQAACTPLWTAPTAYFDGMTIANGDVYVTDGEGVQAFDAAGSKNCSGTPRVCVPLWATSTHTSTGPAFTPGPGSPVFASGVLYVPGYGDGLPSARAGPTLYAFDAAGSASCSAGAAGKTCTPLWTAATSGSIGGTPAVANGVVYTVSGNGMLSAFDAAGSLNCSGSGTARTCSPLWGAVTGFTGGGSPAVVSGVLYINVAGNGTVYAYSLTA